MSLLAIVQDACALIGIDAPTAVMSSGDTTYTQLASIAQVEGDELARFHDWRGLKVQATATGDGTSTYFDLPVDFDRWISGGDPFWQDDSGRLVYGPASDEKFTEAVAMNFDPVTPMWRLVGDQIQFHPAPESGYVIRTGYTSSYWIVDSLGTTRRSRWVADGDEASIPERLIVLGVVWRWKRIKGLDYAEEFRTHQMERLKAARADGGLATLNMGACTDHDWRKNAYTVTP